MTAVLAVEGVSAGHGGVTAVRDVSVEVGRGEVLAVLGANGAGKTTTLDAIAGMAPVTEGRVVLDGQDVTDLAPHRRARLGIGYVLEDRGLFYPLSVRQNLQLAAGRSHRRQRAAVDAAVDRFGDLAAHLDRPAGLLSGGQQQMLAMARALVPEPSLLLVDEMSHGLAPMIVESLLPMIRTVAADGAAVVLVEQHVGVALGVADRAVVLSGGHVSLAGDAGELAGRAEAVTDAYLG